VIVNVPAYGPGLVAAYNHATRTGAGDDEWEAFVAAFAANFHPKYDRKIIMLQLRHELGLDRNTKLPDR
jgi:hypothetical protein